MGLQEADDQHALVRRNLAISNLPIHSSNGTGQVTGGYNVRQLELRARALPGWPDAFEDGSTGNGIAVLGFVDHCLDDALCLAFAQCIQCQQDL